MGCGVWSPSKFSRSPMEQIDLKIHVHVALYAQNVEMVWKSICPGNPCTVRSMFVWPGLLKHPIHLSYNTESQWQFVYMYIEIFFFIIVELTQSRGACNCGLQQKIRVHVRHSVAVKTNRKLTNLLSLIKEKKNLRLHLFNFNVVARTRNNFSTVVLLL